MIWKETKSHHHHQHVLVKPKRTRRESSRIDYGKLSKISDEETVRSDVFVHNGEVTRVNRIQLLYNPSRLLSKPCEGHYTLNAPTVVPPCRKNRRGSSDQECFAARSPLIFSLTLQRDHSSVVLPTSKPTTADHASLGCCAVCALHIFEQ